MKFFIPVVKIHPPLALEKSCHTTFSQLNVDW